MSEHFNQDHFKVGGGDFSSTDRAAQGKAKYANARAQLRSEMAGEIPAARRRKKSNAAEEAVVVTAVTAAKARVGKKRRARKKEADARPADARLDAVAAAEAGPSTLPRAAKRLLGEAREAGREALDAARDLRKHPTHITRVVRSLGGRLKQVGQVAKILFEEFTSKPSRPQT